MKIKNLLLASLLMLGCVSTAYADKGMWILSELTKQNLDRMKELGFALPADSLYNLDKASVTRSVVQFGGGCTGVTVSDQGLILTNHHCGYGAIQSQSSVDHDYLRDGFVAQSLSAELPIEGLQVRYLRKVENVTKEVLMLVGNESDEMMRIQKARAAGKEIAKSVKLEKHQEAIVVPFYANNEYYMIVYDVFKDVRMVFAPPSSIGKFGGDTDNWMWPRHTGDFSAFRVYAGKDNRPSEYNKNNKPYKPEYYATVSLDGYQPGDYAMTIGFPGSTDRYLTSWGVENRMNNENAPRIEVRGAKQTIWRSAMNADQATRIKYASKYARSSNFWKNSIGMNKALKELGVVENKRMEEERFAQWAANKADYANVLKETKQAYEDKGAITKDLTYLYETLVYGAEIIGISRKAEEAIRLGKKGKQQLESLKSNYYKDYLPQLDEKVLVAMMTLLRDRVSQERLPDIYRVVDRDFGGDIKRYAQHVFENSATISYEKMQHTCELGAKERENIIKQDPAIQLSTSVFDQYRALREEGEQAEKAIQRGRRLYFAGRREMDPNTPMPSDANLTMRMSYGSIGGYSPKDGHLYSHFTTQRGILEKQNPESTEFAVQPEILSLLKKGNFAPYGCEKTLKTCFLSDNDITGGNSGSPVFDKNGRLIGLAFDGNWEAMSGDIEFDKNMQRTISVDIRYVLFVIDRWGKAPHLVKELKLMKDNKTIAQMPNQERCDRRCL
nr:S46 family peptidase [Porphyromonas crevioricanis]